MKGFRLWALGLYGVALPPVLNSTSTASRTCRKMLLGFFMQDKSDEVTPRNFNLMSAVGLSDEARKALHAAFDAMSTWRIETAKTSEKNSELVIEKMAAAARALGWPNEIVDSIRAQMQGITRMQIQMMDHVMVSGLRSGRSPRGGAPSALWACV